MCVCVHAGVCVCVCVRMQLAHLPANPKQICFVSVRRQLASLQQQRDAAWHEVKQLRVELLAATNAKEEASRFMEAVQVRMGCADE